MRHLDYPRLLFLVDGALGEAAISGVGDVGSLENGRWSLPRAQPELWFPIVGFLLFQGFLIFALLRLREN